MPELTFENALRAGHDLATQVTGARRRLLEERNLASSQALQLGVRGQMIVQGYDPGTLLAIGDSWFAFWPEGDLLDLLQQRYGYTVDSKAKAGVTLQQIAAPQGQLSWLLERIADLSAAGKQRLRAIVISGGGNDVVGDRQVLKSLLNPMNSSPDFINEEAVRKFIDEKLCQTLMQILSAITEICRIELKRVVPIVVHGYDYPVPDGRRAMSLYGPWLQPALWELGYTNPIVQKTIMVKLIDCLNDMQLRVARMPQFNEAVFHVDLRKTLSTDVNYRQYWQDELHPTIPKGFGAVASAFAAVLYALPPVP